MSHFKNEGQGLRSKQVCPFSRTESEHLCWGGVGGGQVTDPMMGHPTPTSGVLENV